jgi:hypothetical protein
MAELAGLLLALPGVIDLCFKYGELLKEKLDLFLKADEHSSLQRIIVDLVDGNIKDTLRFFQHIAGQLEPGFSAQLEDLLRTLTNTLAKALSAFPTDKGAGGKSAAATTASATKKISSLASNWAARAKYAMYDARRIDEACRELEAWQDRYLKRVTVYMQFVHYPATAGALPLGSGSGGANASAHAATNTASPHTGHSDGGSSPFPSTHHAEHDATNDIAALLERVRLGRKPVTGPLRISHDPATRYERIDVSPLWKPLPTSASAPDASSFSRAAAAKLVEFRGYAGADARTVDVMRATVRNVAAELRRVDAATMGILECVGFSDEPLQQRFVLHFATPVPLRSAAGPVGDGDGAGGDGGGAGTDDGDPRSLRALLADERNKRLGKKHSISDRVRLAQRVATAVLYVHSCGFVHKNIRPDNIIVFSDAAFAAGPADAQTAAEVAAQRHLLRFPYKLGRPFLAGYDGIREEQAFTTLADAASWRERIYLPPDRLVAERAARARFSWRHDVYSLGVVLLELALWEDFTDAGGRMGRLLRQAADPSGVLLERVKEVPRIMGDKYADAVRACLRMLQGEGGGSGGDGVGADATALQDEQWQALRDEDGVVIGASYIAQVMGRLEDISI